MSKSNSTLSGSRSDRQFLDGQSGLHSLSTTAGRLRRLVRARQQRLIPPLGLALIGLALAGVPVAVVPSAHLVLGVGLALAAALGALAIGLSRWGRPAQANWSCVLGLLALYAAALLFAPAGAGVPVALPGFASDPLPYFVFGALPVAAGVLLLDPAVAVVGNGVVLSLNLWCVWAIPHDGAYDRLVAGMGGPLALTGGLMLAQVGVAAVTLAAANATRRTLATAVTTLEGTGTSARGGRDRKLQEDIATLQQTLARIANGELAHVVLSPTSELYPVATSLNLMAVRLARLSRAEIDLRQIEKGLAEASRVIDRISEGDLLTQPASTGTMVDGLLSSLVQVQGHIATWLQGLASGLQDARQDNAKAMELARELASETRKIEEMARQVPEIVPAAGGEVIVGAYHNAGELVRRLRATDVRLRYLAQAVQRIQSVQVGGAVGRLAPIEIPAPLDGASGES